MTESVPLSELTAALYTHADVAGLTEVLTSALAGVLPADLVTIVRRRTLADRAKGRAGTPTALLVRVGDKELALTRSATGAAATIGHVVRGVRLSSTPVELDAWFATLATELRRLAARDEHARQVLERFLLD